MLTAVFLVIFGGILVGCMVWLAMFRQGRKNQAGKAEVTAQRQAPEPGRATGRGNN